MSDVQVSHDGDQGYVHMVGYALRGTGYQDVVVTANVRRVIAAMQTDPIVWIHVIAAVHADHLSRYERELKGAAR